LKHKAYNYFRNCGLVLTLVTKGYIDTNVVSWIEKNGFFLNRASRDGASIVKQDDLMLKLF